MCQIFAGLDPETYTCHTRRLRLNGQSTSIRLENAFWRSLDNIAASEGVSTPCFISKLHSEVTELRGEDVNFTSLLRCACLKFREVSDSSSATNSLESITAGSNKSQPYSIAVNATS